MRFLKLFTIVISILVVLHIKYIEVNSSEGLKIITDTFNNLMLSFSSNMALSNAGGGIIGALFSYLFVTCFGEGAIIVTFTLLVLGIILMLNVSILALINKIKPFITNLFERLKTSKLQLEDVSISVILSEIEAMVSGLSTFLV